MDRKQRIDAWMDEHAGELLEDLKTLCRIRSVAGEPAENAPYGPGPAKALDAALVMCAGYGFSVRDHDRRVLTADYGPADRALDILAHLDVVDENTGWDSDPYEPVIRDDGYIYGRGVADDKGGAVAALYALRCVKELGLPMTRGVRLILGTDEECGSSDVAYYYRHNAPAPNTFTPDAEFPVGNAEKGMYRLRFRKSWAPETALPRVTELHGGVHILVYGISPAFTLAHPDVFDLPLSDLYALVHENGGMLVQAHPFRGGKNRLQDLAFLDGVEANSHPLYDATHVDRLTEIAQSRALILTSGGDYHADTHRPHCGAYLPDSIRTTEDLCEFLRTTESIDLEIQEPGEMQSRRVTYIRHP